jgi:hypothetical protein
VPLEAAMSALTLTLGLIAVVIWCVLAMIGIIHAKDR